MDSERCWAIACPLVDKIKIAPSLHLSKKSLLILFEYKNYVKSKNWPNIVLKRMPWLLTIKSGFKKQKVPIRIKKTSLRITKFPFLTSSTLSFFKPGRNSVKTSYLVLQWTFKKKILDCLSTFRNTKIVNRLKKILWKFWARF